MLDLLVAEDAGFRRLFALLGKTPIFVATEDIAAQPPEIVAHIAQSLGATIDEPALDAMIATSASYPRDPEAARKVKSTADALRKRAFQGP